jgi:hypothetical protein
LLDRFNIRVTVIALSNKACDATGPKEIKISGRCLSTAEWLDEWVQTAAKPVKAGKARRAAAEAAALG